MFFYTHFVFVFLSIKYLSYNVVTFEEDDPRKCDAPVSPRLPRPGPALLLPAWATLRPAGPMYRCKHWRPERAI